MVESAIPAWVAALLIFLAASLGSIALALAWEAWRDRARRRELVGKLRSLGVGPGLGGVQGATLLRAPTLADHGWLRPVVARIPHLRDIETVLQQAGLTWKATSFLMTSAGIAAAFGLSALVLTSRPGVALWAAVAGALAPYGFVRRKRTLRFRAFEEQLPEAIDLLGRAIRAGHPLTSGIKMVADESAEPVAGEFRTVFEEQRFGLPFDDALIGLTDRIPLVDVRIIVTAILVQREVGGNLAEILDNIAHTIRARFVIRRQLRTYTAQGRLSGYILAVLPIAVGTVIFMMNPDYILTLFRERIGHLMLVTGAVTQILGFLWIRKIINIEI